MQYLEKFLNGKRRIIFLSVLVLILPSSTYGEESCTQSDILQLVQDWSQGRASIREVLSAIDLWTQNKPCPVTDTIDATITAGTDVFSGQIVELRSMDGGLVENGTTSKTGEVSWSEPKGENYWIYVPETLYTYAAGKELTNDGTRVNIRVTYKPTYTLHVSVFDPAGSKLETLDTELRLNGTLLEKVSVKGNEYTYRTVPENYTVHASSQGYGAQDQTVTLGLTGANISFVLQ
jgi:hypothetical protein